MQIFLNVAHCFLIVAGLSPLIRTGEWWIRLFDFPRFQLLLLGILVLGVQYAVGFSEPFWLHYTLVLMTAAVTLYQAARVIFFFRHPFKEVSDAESPRREGEFSAVIANVQYRNSKYSSLIRCIEQTDPDWLALLETDSDWQRELAPLREKFTYYIEEPRPKGCGMSFYSRVPVVSSQVQYLVSPERPSFHLILRDKAGQKIELFILHPAPPGLPTADGELQDSGPRDAELVIVAHKIKHSPYPVIAAGDFNDAAWSHTTRIFKRISGLSDPRTGRGFFSTYPATFWPFRVPIDHVFVSSHFRLRKMEVLPPFGSDHLGIHFQLQLTREGAEAERDGDIPESYEQEVVREGKEEAQKYAEQEQHATQ